MPTLQDTRRAIAERQEQDYLRSIEFDRANEARREEVTDMSERLAMPMESTFYYELFDDKLYSEFGTPLDDVILDGYEDIVRKAETRPDLGFEVVRRGLDMEELGDVKALEPGQKLVVFLPIPDAVRLGKTTIDGYNRERMKMLVRIGARGTGKNQNKFSITGFSLDGSHYPAMQAAAEAIGHEIPAGLSSEQIVARRKRLDTDESSKEIVDKIRDSYDEKLGEIKGGRWYAGRDASELESTYDEAYTFVNSQTSLIDEHMAFLKGLESRLAGVELDRAREDARYNLAATLDRVRKGQTVTSIADSGAQARAAGLNYDGDCPTGNSSANVESQANALGFKTTKEFVTNCPHCGEKKVKAKMSGGTISCGSCKVVVDVCTGEIISKHQPKNRLGKKALAEAIKNPPKKLSKAQMIRAKYGSAVSEHREIVIGGEVRYFVHKETGQRIDL